MNDIKLTTSYEQKMVNNIKSTGRLEIMARLPKSDDVWNEIFDSLILDNEPPIQYIKNVVITTKAGVRLRVSAIDFVQILERERFINPDESDILSCRLAINFDKVRKDVDEWADQKLYQFDNNGKLKPKVKKTQKTTKANPKSKKPVQAVKRVSKITKNSATKTTPVKKTSSRKSNTTKKG